MKLIKTYLLEWNLIRIIKLIFAVILFISYYYNRENFFMIFGIILASQAVFNLSCPGGSCKVSTEKGTKQIVETEKYEPKK